MVFFGKSKTEDFNFKAKKSYFKKFYNSQLFVLGSLAIKCFKTGFKYVDIKIQKIMFLHEKYFF